MTPDQNQNRWREFWKRLEASGDAAPVYESLVTSYSEPHRAYHNLVHIAECLAEFENVRQLADAENAVEMAIWFHDVIYDPKAKDNEDQSAHEASAVIQAAGLGDTFSQRVTRLILATKHNSTPEDKDTALLIDIDLSILGKSHERFAEYEMQIRKEYAWVADDAFRLGRSKILRAFLERPSIYYTSYFRDRYEANARRNLDWSLKQLGNVR